MGDQYPHHAQYVAEQRIGGSLREVMSRVAWWDQGKDLRCQWGGGMLAAGGERVGLLALGHQRACQGEGLEPQVLAVAEENLE